MLLAVNLTSLPGNTYSIHLKDELFKKIPAILKQLKQAHHYIIICDSTVKKLYGTALLKNLRTSGYLTDLISFSAGEKFKNESTKSKIERQLFQKKCGRDTMIIALGGGVTGDLAGFIAATYMRGISYIHVPTSLLAMVDSSIGGKVGIDTEFGKNLIGAFWHPQAIIVDTEVLKTLPEQHFRNGLFEIMKIFLTHDVKAFNYFQKNLAKILARNSIILNKIITRAMQLKIQVIEKDERENGERATLNCGHTIGHALEKLTNFSLLHGYAVGFGMLLESKISELSGVLSVQGFQEIADVLSNLGITSTEFRKISKKIKPVDLIQAMQHDKKNRSGQINFVLLKAIGKVKIDQGKFVHPVLPTMIKKALQLLATSYQNPATRTQLPSTKT